MYTSPFKYDHVGYLYMLSFEGAYKYTNLVGGFNPFEKY